MSAEIGYTAVPSPERISVLRVGFRPNQKLYEALRLFLLPEAQRRSITFLSEGSRRVPFDAANGGGLVYGREYSTKVEDDRRQIHSMQHTSIAIGASDLAIVPSRPEVGLVLALKLELLPTKDQRKRLTSFVLDQFRQERTSLFAVTHFQQPSLVKGERALADAENNLRDQLGTENADARHLIGRSALQLIQPTLVTEIPRQGRPR